MLKRMSATAIAGSANVRGTSARTSGSGSGSASSPISVASTPNTRPSTPEDHSVADLSRPRAIAAAGSPSPSPHHSANTGTLHPFFTRPRVPVPRQPRLVATYASTTTESSDGTQTSFSTFSTGTWYSASQGSFWDSQSSGPGLGSQLSQISAGNEGDNETELSSRSRGDVVPPPHGWRSFRPSKEVTDLTEELGRMDLRTSPGRSFPQTTKGKAPVTVEDEEAEWPALSPTKSAEVRTGYAAAATTKVTVREKLLAAKRPESVAGASNAVPGSKRYFSHHAPIPGHFTRPPNVAYTTDPSEVTDLISCLSGPISLDLEWPPPGQGPAYLRRTKDGSLVYVRQPVWDPILRKKTWPEAPVSIVQLADARLVIVFQLLHHPEAHLQTKPGQVLPHAMPPALLQLLSDPTRPKVGVNIRGDGQKLMRDFGVHTSGLLELSTLAKAVDPERWGETKWLISMTRLADAYLGMELEKGVVRTCDWSQKLDQEQVNYAADDAYAGRLIHDALMRRAEEKGVNVNTGSMLFGVEPKVKKPVLRATAPAFEPRVSEKKGESAAQVPIRSAVLEAKAAPAVKSKFRPDAASGGKPAAKSAPAAPKQVQRASSPTAGSVTAPGSKLPPQPASTSTTGVVTAYGLFESGLSVSQIASRFRLQARATQILVLDGASARSAELGGEVTARLREEFAEDNSVWRKYVVLRTVVWGAQKSDAWN